MKTQKSQISIVIPAHQAAGTLQSCLEAVFANGIHPNDVLVVDDGSSDATGAIAKDAGVRVLHNDTALGPARARNAGVAAVASGIVLFIDADVVVRPDVVERVLTHFQHPETTAAIGSYDNAPPAHSIVSRYRNLLHFFVHQGAKTEAETFWTGIGAVRRAQYIKLGGLDHNWENIEDVEFGLRLRAAGGRIKLDPKIQGTHLKQWTVTSMFRTDLWGRAVPWARLIRDGHTQTGQLNTGNAHRLSALCVAVFALAVAASIFWSHALWIAVLAILCFLITNASFLITLYRIGGVSLALGAIPYHALHYAAAIAGYTYASLFPTRN